MIAAVLSAVACWVALSRPGPGRLARASIGTRRPAGPVRPTPEQLAGQPVVRAAICLATGMVIGDLMMGRPGLPIGAVLGAVGALFLGRLEPSHVRRARERAEADLPLAIDLLASCAAAGRPLDASLLAVADAVGAPLAEPFRRVAHRLTLGDSGAGWESVMHHPELARLARTMTRMARAGAPLTPTLLRLAEDQRRERRWSNERRARAVGVHAAGPLAACFLPAFMLVGVVPTIVGMVGDLGF
jgi:pilus assembly protein TadC